MKKTLIAVAVLSVISSSTLALTVEDSDSPYQNPINTADGLTKKLIYAIKQLNSEQIYNEIKQIKKAEIAINLLYSDKIDNIIVPEYITEGLKFIESSLNNLHNPQKEIVNAK